MRYIAESQRTTILVELKIVTHTYGDLFAYAGKHWIPENLMVRYASNDAPTWDLVARAQVKGSGPGKTTKHFSPIMVQSVSHDVYVRLDEIAREADPRPATTPVGTCPSHPEWQAEVCPVCYLQQSVTPHTLGMVGARCTYHPHFDLYQDQDPNLPGREVVGCSKCFDIWRSLTVL